MPENVIDIYGHTVDLKPSEEGVVTDVMVIAREVWYDEDGFAKDALLTSGSKGCSQMIRQGMGNQLMLALGSSPAIDL